MGITNNSGFVLREIEGMRLFGTFTNEWRARRVQVREHPTDSSMVVTVGVATNGDQTTICAEPRSLYASRIDNNDWSTYR